MTPKMPPISWALLFLASTLVSQSGSAQRLYDPRRDEQAQAAKKKADEITSGQIFDAQIENIQKLFPRDFEAYFLDARRTMRTGIGRFTTWDEVLGAVEDRVPGDLPEPPDAAYIENRRRELKQQIEDAQSELERLKKKIAAYNDAGLDAVAGELGNLGELEVLGEGFLKPANAAAGSPSPEAATELIGTARQLAKLYRSYAERIDAINEQLQEVEKQLLVLRVPLMEIALARLEAEEAHLKRLAAIESRRVAEEGSIRRLRGDFDKRIKALRDPKGYAVLPPENAVSHLTIAETLAAVVSEPNPPQALKTELGDDVNKWSEARRKRERLTHALLALHQATALMARGRTANHLADLRLAHEFHLYSIRQSAITARAYESTISTGVQRLALYHKGGIKAETVAQLIHAAAAVAIPPAILAK